MQPGDLIDGSNGRYEIQQRIVRGQLSSVYRARDLITGDAVAVKATRKGADDNIAERLRLECSVLSKLDHPNIAKFYDFSEDATNCYLVERWIDGPSLRRTLNTSGLTLPDAVKMGLQVASALGAAHEQGVIHRDIKPENLLWSGSEWIVIDYGLARVLGEQFHVTRTGAVLGTLGYMAPEQACALRDIDLRADVFALGCILYETICGQLAFSGDSRLAIEAKLLVVDPPPIRELVPEVPAALSELVMSCLCKAAAGRPANGGELEYALAEIAASPLPALPARKVERAELPTIQDENAPIVSVVVTAPMTEVTPTSLSEWEARVRTILGPFGGEPMVLQTGAVLFVAPARLSPSTDTAAAAALALQDQAPETPIAIASARGSDHMAPSLEVVGAQLERSALENLFADHASSNIRLDLLTAGHLGSQFEIITIDDICYLSGWR